ncbi:uncharacterized protein C8Q71DRAFT_423557 [Rhodofomes roseus]|uniref:Uncharacterized protein n=1 Tax=Rhodofomes roseus TaxID=34475 RepID=A0ABQ8KR23_9APHY|nr:uncharacterized protein C8Q71DRAFT_423557 [Rhodofomes roseus]KAH9840797.1 hypothetical protein C8Q71DRAFT_423557 [Rhodofomes roseus]
MGLERIARPLPKRRRLVSAQSSLKDASTLTTPVEQHLDLVNDGIPVCVSCHRSFPRKVNEVVRCARFAIRAVCVCATDCRLRCRATTCLVCSRTCSAPPLSMPPTPALTRSSTPSPSPSPSPRRPALALSTNSRTANALSNPAPERTPAGKRRKPLQSDTDGDEQPSWSLGIEKASKEATPRGCGRTVCRSCCHENALSATTTCYDCLNHPYNHPVQQVDARSSH